MILHSEKSGLVMIVTFLFFHFCHACYNVPIPNKKLKFVLLFSASCAYSFAYLFLSLSSFLSWALLSKMMVPKFLVY